MNSPLLIQELPYLADSSARFEPFADEPWSIWLDSAGFGAPLGRYDILVADPLVTLVTHAGGTTFTQRNGEQECVTGDPFELLRKELERFSLSSTCAELPFVGGAVGYFGYDLARLLHTLPQLAEDELKLPEMALGIYEWAYVADHQEQKCWLAGINSSSLAERWKRLCQDFAAAAPMARQRPSLKLQQRPHSDLDEEAYGAAFRRIKHYLHEGDCYQINLARRFNAKVTGDPYAGYCRLRKRNSAPFSAYLNLPCGQILSSSPERFLRVVERQVETRPIKGTRPRSCDPLLDKKLAEELQQSPKDRAENVMIVDLLRNDLGKSCSSGSVRVPQLFALESYATVHHLVSTVIGTLASGKQHLDLLRDAFPGGSITGAPKRRAMEIIEELEPQRRGVYCGAIGYLGFDGKMDTNIAIRTLLHRNGEIYFWAGSGIVIDSDQESEFQETLHKAAGMVRLFEEGEG